MTEEEMQELVQNAFQRTLKELKENPDNVFNYLELQKKYNTVLKDKTKLQGENQELKNQLENCYCNRTDCSSRIKDSKKYDSLVQKVEKQQKEFIEWLESEIERIPTLTTFFYNREGHYISETEVMLKEAKKVYKKYKEIIGVKDETPGNNRCRFN